MTSDMERYERKIERARQDKGRHMSDTKWRKLFAAIETASLDYRAKLKLLADERVYPFHLSPGMHESGKYTADGASPPVRLKDIEWIFVPASLEMERFNRGEKLQSIHVAQDLASLKRLMDGLGVFECDDDENGMKIYAYR